MDFGRIKKNKGGIELNMWNHIIQSHSALIQAPERKAINPFTKEESLITNIGVAYYKENGKPVGNISLEEGELLTTGGLTPNIRTLS